MAHHRTLFIYWGRRGALSQLTLELAKALGRSGFFSVSRQNELFDQFPSTGVRLIPVDTFTHAAKAVLNIPRILSIRRRLRAAIAEHHIGRVVVLMPHVWTPLIAGSVRAAGARYIVIVHDGDAHPGDMTALVTAWLRRDALHADRIVTLSRHVADLLIARYPTLDRKVQVLFLPMLPMGKVREPAAFHVPLGFLFLGRIMAYKGLPLFIEACELLRARGHSFRIGVVGEGALGSAEIRLRALGASIVNRWVPHDEIATLVADYDAVVTSHIEASQSGVVPTAHALGLPVLTTPVGGLPEQVEDGRTGLVAREISATAVAELMERYLTDDGLRQRLTASIRQIGDERSVGRFLAALSAA